MMKMTLTYNDFERAFWDYDRYQDFGSDALEALWDYLREYEEATGEENEDYEDYTERVLEELERTTSVIRYPGGAIVEAF